MLTGACIHPDLMRVLSLCGHGDKVLIADGNYPLASRSGGCVEKAEVMDPEDGSTPEIFGVFRQMLGGMELQGLGRYAFYNACCEPGVRLAVSTGEGRTFANLLLTIGVADGIH